MLPIFEPVNSAWPLIGLSPFTLLAHEYNPFLTFFSGLTYSSLQLHVLNYNISAAAAAKSLQSCPTLCDPIDGNPPGSPVPGILQARTLEWVAIAFSEYLCYCRINWIFGISWRREWQSTPVFLPGEFHERGGEPGRLQSMESQRIRHDWVTNIHTHLVSWVCLSLPLFF